MRILLDECVPWQAPPGVAETNHRALVATDFVVEVRGALNHVWGHVADA